jgi:hypothetical protein
MLAAFLEEPDQDEIIYYEKELQEIETHKKERILKMSKQRSGGCRAMCYNLRGSKFVVNALVMG